MASTYDTDRTAWRKLRLVILNRDQHTCHWCGNHANTVDHVWPRIDGGTDHPANLVAACMGCNSRRSYLWRVANGRQKRWGESLPAQPAGRQVGGALAGPFFEQVGGPA